MDYSRFLEELEQASLFDLYRLQVAIGHQLDDPRRIQEIKKRIKPDRRSSTLTSGRTGPSKPR